MHGLHLRLQRPAIGPGVQLYPVRPDIGGRRRRRGFGIYEQRHPDPRRLHPLDRRGQHGAIGFDVPAMVGGRLQRVVGHERHLVRRGALDEGQEVLGRVALDVELAARIVLPQQRHQLEHIGASDMPFVRPRMHGDAVGPRIERDAGNAGDARPWHRTPVAQHGDGIEIDAEMSHRGTSAERGRGLAHRAPASQSNVLMSPISP